MSLLDSPSRAHAPPVKRFSERLRTGDEYERAVLLNLQEEDRVPDSRRAAFQAALAGSKRRSWNDRFTKDAAPAAQRALPVPSPRPPAIAGSWWSHVTFAGLQKYKYVSLTVQKGSRPPRRLPLARPLGRPETGADRTFWITKAVSPSADELRDRLGLYYFGRGDRIYRVSIGMDTAPRRALYVPSALDAGFYPAWRRPSASHTHPWGMTRHLDTDAPSEAELLALPDAADALEAHDLGVVATDPPRGYLRARGIS
jgi:hypothetical protein